MRGQPCPPAWRHCVLLLGAWWVVTLVAACGGGDDDVVATPVATGAVGSGARTEAGATAVAALPLQTPTHVQGQAAGNVEGALPAPLPQPSDDESRRLAQSADVPAHPSETRVPGDALDDEALNRPVGHPGAGASGADPFADPFEAN